MRTRLLSRLVSAAVLISLLLGTGIAVSAATLGAASHSTTITFTPKAGAAVKSSSPGANYGADTKLSARSSPTVHSYLRFEVSGLNGATVFSARLRLYTRTGSSRAVNAKSVSSDTWGETSITYAKAPAIGTTVGAYVVLKVFVGYKNCANQPNDWHQYSPAASVTQEGKHSYSISPGFWLVGQNVRLSRDVTRWQKDVRDMVASGAQWQLVTTFSEWGEGTAVEPAAQWASSSGYGQYLDALHYNGNVP